MAALLSLANASASAQQIAAVWPLIGGDVASEAAARIDTAPALVSPPIMPRMAAELALNVFQQRSAAQSAQLGGSSDTTIIKAELPDSQQRGEYELKRFYEAPRNLSFSPIRFVGDGFMRSNVMVRLLQSEVQHVEKGHGTDTALSEANYKFSYKGTDVLNGELLHVYAIKPRRKAPGLFKGKIYLNAFTGSIRRAEGSLVKSPSVLIKKVEFVQDYADIGPFTFPVHLRSISKVRVIGRAIVDIFHRDIETRSARAISAASASPGAN